MQQQQPCRRLHVMTLGDGGAGKSCLVKRFCEGRFVPRHIATVGIDYGVRRVAAAPGGGGGVRLNFFDASGLAAYAAVRRDFYRDAEVVRASCVCSPQWGGTAPAGLATSSRGAAGCGPLPHAAPVRMHTG